MRLISISVSKGNHIMMWPTRQSVLLKAVSKINIYICFSLTQQWLMCFDGLKSTLISIYDTRFQNKATAKTNTLASERHRTLFRILKKQIKANYLTHLAFFSCMTSKRVSDLFICSSLILISSLRASLKSQLSSGDLLWMQILACVVVIWIMKTETGFSSISEFNE